MVRDKAYVCNFCRKVITYSPDQAGSSLTCPFCKSPVRFPPLSLAPAEQAAAGKAPSHHRRVSPVPILVLLSFAAVAGAAAYYYVARPVDKQRDPEQPQTPLSELLRPRTAVAPAAVSVRWAHTQIAVTDVQYGCPDICNAALKRQGPSETPVLALRVEVTNTGDEPNAFRTWRIFDAMADRRKAILRDPAQEAPFSLVTFGVDTYPAGVHLGNQTLPGQTVKDIVLFMCPKKPEGDLTLTLPCENVGGREEDVIITIPRAMIR